MTYSRQRRLVTAGLLSLSLLGFGCKHEDDDPNGIMDPPPTGDVLVEARVQGGSVQSAANAVLSWGRLSHLGIPDVFQVIGNFRDGDKALTLGISLEGPPRVGRFDLTEGTTLAMVFYNLQLGEAIVPTHVTKATVPGLLVISAFDEASLTCEGTFSIQAFARSGRAPDVIAISEGTFRGKVTFPPSQ